MDKLKGKNQDLIYDYLQRYGFSDVLGQSMVDRMKIYHFRPGDYIAKSYEKLTHFYFYVQGKSKVFLTLENGKSLLCRFYHPPQIVGDVELFSGKRNTCNLQALTEVTCIGMRMNEFRKAAESNKQLLAMICSTLGNKLANFNTISAVNQNYLLEERLASYLMAVTKQDSSTESMVDEIHTDNLTELADLLGTSYRHLTRTIKMFLDHGIILKKNKRLIIADRSKLQAIGKNIYV